MVMTMVMMILVAVIIIIFFCFIIIIIIINFFFIIIFFIIIFILIEKTSARPRFALLCQRREASQQFSRLDLGSSVRLSHQRFVHFDAGQAESLAKWLACFEALKAERTSGEEEAAESKVSSPKAAYNARKRTFLYRKHSYRARKPKAPPGRVTASLPDEMWVDVAPSRSETWLSAWRNVQGCGSSDNELDILELPEETRARHPKCQSHSEDWKPAEHFAAEGVEEVTAAVRAGLEPEDRQGAWPLLAAAAAKRRRKGRPYDSLVAEGKDLEENEAVRTIQADLHRTGMEDVDVCSLENVLLSFAATNPEIGYCQSMSFVAATLLHYLPEAGLLCAGQGYFASRMVGLRTDLRVLSVLLSQYLPSLADHLEAQEIDLSPITVNWFLCLFLNTLPAKWSHRVLDTVLYEGSVTLFRLALAILSFRSKELLSCNSVPDAFIYLRSPCDCRGPAKAAEGAELWELMFAEPAGLCYLGRQLRLQRPYTSRLTFPVDFSDLTTVKAAAQELIGSLTKLDYLVNNAGTYNHPHACTKQGHEWHMGVNHLGAVLFTLLLTPLLIKSAPARVVLTSSALHYSTGGRGRKLGYIDYEDWNWITRSYERELAMTQSMLANVMWATEYAERFGQQGITAVSVHPGCVSTGAQRHMLGEGCYASCFKCFLKWGIRMIDVWPGSQSTLYALLSDDVPNHNGGHFAQAYSPVLPFGEPVYETKDQDSGGWPMAEPLPFARDPVNRARLWKLSEDAVRFFLHRP
eukprot:s127_g4.t1